MGVTYDQFRLRWELRFGLIETVWGAEDDIWMGL